MPSAWALFPVEGDLSTSHIAREGQEGKRASNVPVHLIYSYSFHKYVEHLPGIVLHARNRVVNKIKSMFALRSTV